MAAAVDPRIRRTSSSYFSTTPRVSSAIAGVSFLLSWLLSPRHGLLLRRPALAS